MWNSGECRGGKWDQFLFLFMGTSRQGGRVAVGTKRLSCYNKGENQGPVNKLNKKKNGKTISYQTECYETDRTMCQIVGKRHCSA